MELLAFIVLAREKIAISMIGFTFKSRFIVPLLQFVTNCYVWSPRMDLFGSLGSLGPRCLGSLPRQLSGHPLVTHVISGHI